MARQQFSDGSAVEDYAGFSQAVRVGNAVFVSGSNAADGEGQIKDKADAETQARVTLQKIKESLEQAGASLDDVVRTRVFLRNPADAQAVAAVHKEFFDKIRPANSFVRAEPIGEDMLVEIEADAIIE